VAAHVVVRVLQKKIYHFTWIFQMVTQIMMHDDQRRTSGSRLACGNGDPNSPLTRLFPVSVASACVTTSRYLRTLPVGIHLRYRPNCCSHFSMERNLVGTPNRVEMLRWLHDLIAYLTVLR